MNPFGFDIFPANSMLLIDLSTMKNKNGLFALNFGGSDLFGKAAPEKKDRLFCIKN